VKVAGGHLKKLDDRSTPMVFIGYEVGTKAYRFYNPVSKRVHISRDVVFDEGRAWDWTERDGGAHAADTEPFHVEYTTVTTRRGAPDEPHQGGDGPGTLVPGGGTPATPRTPVANEGSPGSAHESGDPRAPVAPAPNPQVEFATPHSGALDLDDEHEDEAPLRFRTIDNVFEIGPAEVASMTEQEVKVDEDLLLAMGEEPATFEEARREDCWRQAMKEEMASIEQNGTWKLVNLPNGHRPIGVKWVFKVKRDEAGTIVKHKARLVAKGYIQQEGVDFDEVFAPVARMESIWMLLAVAAREGWLVHHMDVKSAFLNGDLQEEVYVRQPPGFVAAGHEGKVLKLQKALYGLRQAPRAWNMKLDASLRKLGFKRCVSEHGMYTRGAGKTRVVVGVYVDDLIITGASPEDISAFKEEMCQLFRMSDLGLLSYYLGIEVKQGRSAITLGQAASRRSCWKRQAWLPASHAQRPWRSTSSYPPRARRPRWTRRCTAA